MEKRVGRFGLSIYRKADNLSKTGFFKLKFAFALHFIEQI